jgi:aspartyl-tRNA(Asn)/glutamyl-tRNA(Gln) amidotransferase subunit C
MAKTLSRSEVEKIALLARLDLTESEKITAADELTQILEYVERLSEVPTDNIEPLVATGVGLETIRPDQAEVFPERKKLLAHKTFKDDLLTTKNVFSSKDHAT